MIQRILVALDASSTAPSVFLKATELARRFDADVQPLRVIQIPPEFPPSAHVGHGDPLPARMRSDAESDLRKLTASAPGVRVATPMVREGQPWRVILAVAEQLDADLVIVGSHGYHGIDRILGTTAAKVANLAKRDVLVVHARLEPPESSRLLAPDEGGGPYR